MAKSLKAKTIRGRILEALKKEKEGLTDPELYERIDVKPWEKMIFDLVLLREKYHPYYRVLRKLKEEGKITYNSTLEKWYYKKGYHPFLWPL